MEHQYLPEEVCQQGHHQGMQKVYVCELPQSSIWNSISSMIFLKYLKNKLGGRGGLSQLIKWLLCQQDGIWESM